MSSVAPLSAREGTSWIAVCPLEAIPDGTARELVTPDGRRLTMFAVRRGARVAVYRDVCPHYGRTQLAWKRDAYLNREGTRIVCSAHGAEFDIASGECLAGPCLGQALTRVPAEVRDGSLWIVASPTLPAIS